jgi:hypothetical protein
MSLNGIDAHRRRRDTSPNAAQGIANGLMIAALGLLTILGVPCSDLELLIGGLSMSTRQFSDELISRLGRINAAIEADEALTSERSALRQAASFWPLGSRLLWCLQLSRKMFRHS